MLAALQVGEDHGSLAEELFAFARSLCPGAPERLHQAVGRRVEATQFAAALARLLRDRRLTLETVEAAGSLASARSNEFREVMRAILEDMQNGISLVQALGRHPRYFDPLYFGFLEAADSRQQFRACLEHLGRS